MHDSGWMNVSDIMTRDRLEQPGLLQKHKDEFENSYSNYMMIARDAPAETDMGQSAANGSFQTAHSRLTFFDKAMKPAISRKRAEESMMKRTQTSFNDLEETGVSSRSLKALLAKEKSKTLSRLNKSDKKALNRGIYASPVHAPVPAIQATLESKALY